jgi:hypothetical protein
MNKKLYTREMLMKLSKECHQRAIDKWFWHVLHSVMHYLMLVISELCEAIEADRKGKWAKLDHDTIDTLQRIEGAPYAQMFLREVKDTVEDEIADAVIRLLDMLGYLFGVMLPPSGFIERISGEYDDREPPKMLTEAIMPIVAETSGLFSLSNYMVGIFYAIKSLEQLCDHLGIDLMTHIELKMKYNEMRPALHGKKY